MNFVELLGLFKPQKNDLESYLLKPYIVLGKDDHGKIVKIKYRDCPHVLIAGTTGSGKSRMLHNIIVNLIMKYSETTKIILIDTKRVEFQRYNGIMQLGRPVITDPDEALHTIKTLVRYIDARNKAIADRGQTTNTEWNRLYGGTMGYMYDVVLIIDEVADLILRNHEIENALARIGNVGRSAGVHAILGTQSPSTKIISTMIKINYPTRIALKVPTNSDSRTILDQVGAEKLKKPGEALLLFNGELIHFNGAYLTNETIARVIRKCEKINDFLWGEKAYQMTESRSEDDELTQQIATYITERDNVYTVSEITREFRIGYNRAKRILNSLE